MKRTRTARLFGKTLRMVCALFPENYLPERTEYRVESDRIPAAFDGFRLVQVSDLHGCTFGRNNGRLVGMIHSAVPDAVVMTGDMADQLDMEYEGLYSLCGELCGLYPVFYVTGNHETGADGFSPENVSGGAACDGSPYPGPFLRGNRPQRPKNPPMRPWNPDEMLTGRTATESGTRI